jgi:N-acetylmuramoyl-L-alanine amidase
MAVPVHAFVTALILTASPMEERAQTAVVRLKNQVVTDGSTRSERLVRARVGVRAPPKRAPAATRPGALSRARALLAEVKRDPAKRRYRHHWERAIHALVRAARGRDAPAALLEAARARYGLYRFSAVESDRDEALALAARAARAGSREAAPFARAIHREAGDEEGAPAKTAKAMAKTKTGHPAAGPGGASVPPAPAAARPEEDEPGDPVLEDPVAESPAGDEKEEKTDEVASGQPPTQPGPVRVTEVKAWSNSDYTRVAVYLSKATGWQKEEIAPEGDRPRRLALDFRPALLEGKAVARPIGDAQVQRVRAAQRDPETVRVVLDLAGSDAYQLFSLDDPPRLIVDVGTREAQREAQASAFPAPPQPPAEQAEPAGEGQGDEGVEAPASRLIRRIVVDAGHGGHDTGAIGPNRVREKDVVLAMAKRLGNRLRRAGFEVVLTRRDDTFLPLEERTAIANASHADLFVSLHANAHPRRDRKGIETYFLNVADGRYAARLAARENGALSPEGGNGLQVQRILSDLDAKTSAGSSRHLARLVQRELCVGVRAHVGEVRDLGVKSALFYVLLGARMPAVLVETAFVSNRAEERRLASARYQEEVAMDVARAIVAFAAREPRVASVR